MPQFLVEKEMCVGTNVVIDGSDAHHISDVLRLRVGDWIVLSNGRGECFRAEISESGRRSVSLLIKEKLPELTSKSVTLAQAVIKHDRTEAIIQKAVELGVADIIPFTSARTIPKFSDRLSSKKIERWNRIAIEAAKQCGLSVRPRVEEIVSFEELIRRSQNHTNKLMFYEGEKVNTIRSYFTDLRTSTPKHLNTIILIGPEGGFSDDEVRLAGENGFTTLKIGPLIMRVETAALAAIVLVQYHLLHPAPTSCKLRTCSGDSSENRRTGRS